MAEDGTETLVAYESYQPFDVVEVEVQIFNNTDPDSNTSPKTNTRNTEKPSNLTRIWAASVLELLP